MQVLVRTRVCVRMWVHAHASVLAKSVIPVMILSVGHDPVGRPCTLPGLTNDRVVFRHWVQNIEIRSKRPSRTHTPTQVQPNSSTWTRHHPASLLRRRAHQRPRPHLAGLGMTIRPNRQCPRMRRCLACCIMTAKSTRPQTQAHVPWWFHSSS